MLEVWWYDRNVKTGPGCEGIRENINSMLLALRIEDHSKFTTYKKRDLFGLERSRIIWGNLK